MTLNDAVKICSYWSFTHGENNCGHVRLKEFPGIRELVNKCYVYDQYI